MRNTVCFLLVDAHLLSDSSAFTTGPQQRVSQLPSNADFRQSIELGDILTFDGSGCAT